MEVDEEEAEEWYGITKAENDYKVDANIDEESDQNSDEENESERIPPPTRRNRLEVVLPTMTEVRNGPLLWTGTVSIQFKTILYSVLTNIEGPMRPLSATEPRRTMHPAPHGLCMRLLSGAQEKMHYN